MVMNIALMGNSALRMAIQRNLVSFPSQIPIFMKRPGGDIQERIAQLYFERGWKVRNICERYGLSKAMVQKLLWGWRIRAVAAGFIQDIHPEDLDALIQVRDESDTPMPSAESLPAMAAEQMSPATAQWMQSSRNRFMTTLTGA
jgi:hypothetical protein